jgi:hypothetical protein
LRTNARVSPDDAPAGRVFTHGRRRGPPAWLGLKLHAAGLPLARDLELHLGARAYVGLSRVEGGRVNVCGLFERRDVPGKGAALLLGYLRAAGIADLADRLERADVDASSCGAVAALGFDRAVVASDRVQLGDACAMIPPFTGNGMAMAFQSAELALEPLLAYARGDVEWSRVARTIHGRLRRRFGLRLASASALHSCLLQPGRQLWLARLNRARLVPLRPLYAALH